MTTQSEVLQQVRTRESCQMYPLLQQLEWFRGTLDPKEFVASYIEKAVQETEAEMKSRGLVPLLHSGDKIRTEVVRAVTEYIGMIKKISELTCQKTSERFTDDEVRIIQARTEFDFRTWLVRIMFVVDAAPQRLLDLSQLLGQIETTFLMGEGFVVELDYTNKRCSELDCTALRRDFPFVGRAATKTKCAQKCESCALA